ncbi:MAG: hypothetical protein HYX26_00690 [Acidobacteriales bacterium]|nr:hypothetical protein [Terriglobales bacterium]
MKSKIQAVILAALVMLALGSASAQKTYCASASCQINTKVYRDGKFWVEELTGSITAGKGLRLESALGAVVVRGGSGDEVTYTIKKKSSRPAEEAAKRDFRIFPIAIYRRTAEYVGIEGDWDGDHSGKLMVEFYVTVPRNSQWVKVNTMGGSVEIKSIAGKAYAETAGGSVTVDDIGETALVSTLGGSISVGAVGGMVKLETAGGSISIGTVGGAIVANTSGGSVQVGVGKKNVSIETAGGGIGVKQCDGSLSASTAGGSIEVERVGGSASVDTAGGSIRILEVKGPVVASTAGGGIRLTKVYGGVRADTQAGPIEVEIAAARGQFTASKLYTSNGDITVYLPSDLPVSIVATVEESNGHDVYSDFSGLNITREGKQYGSGTVQAEGRLNGGGPVLKLYTTNGNIRIRKSGARGRD